MQKYRVTLRKPLNRKAYTMGEEKVKKRKQKMPPNILSGGIL